MDRLSKAYVNCATKLQQRMPVNNQLLKTLSDIDPSASGYSLTLRYLLNLPTLMTNVLAEDEETAYEKEVHLYNQHYLTLGRKRELTNMGSHYRLTPVT